MIGINDVYCGSFVYVAIATSLLKLCDGLRDDQLPELGILLEDREGETVVKFVGKEAGRREKENAKRVCTSNYMTLCQLAGSGYISNVPQHTFTSTSITQTHNEHTVDR